MATGWTVSDIMTREVITLFEEDNLERVSRELSHYRFRHLPVVDDGKLVGILSQRDLLRASVGGLHAGPHARAREARILEETFVRDVMRTDVRTARPDESVASAAQSMIDGHFGALPVVDGNGTLLGIITENDIVRVAAKVL